MLCDEAEVADCDPDAETDPLELDVVELELELLAVVELVELPEVLPLVEVVPVALVVAPFLCVAARQPPRPTKPVTLNAVTMRRARHAGDRRGVPVRVVRARDVSMPSSVSETPVDRLWRGWTTS
ncbi:MAG TPA: hypothetical protein VIB48_01230 [Acidimicrobiia bacterium]